MGAYSPFRPAEAGAQEAADLARSARIDEGRLTACQSRTVPSLLPDTTTFPSAAEGNALNGVYVTGKWAAELCSGLDIPQSDRLSVLPEARVLPSGLNATLRM